MLYRVQASTGPDWVTEWAPRQDQARALVRDLEEAGFADVQVDKMEVPTSREGLALALNRSQDNRTNWPGEAQKT